MTWQCEICDAADGRPFQAREMMHGLRHTFRYVECRNCGAVQIDGVPEDLARYYKNDYYSYVLKTPEKDLKSLVQRLSIFMAVRLPKPLRDRALNQLPWHRLGFNNPQLHTALATQNAASRILDVGAGAGQLVLKLRQMGFDHAIGIDPFLDGDVLYDGRVLVRKQDLFDTEGMYDLICMHHSLEHMTGQHRVLSHIRSLLAPTGRALIRIPLAGGEAWREYGPDWIQLDPPRHLVVHSRRSFEISVKKAGFTIEKLIYDSGVFQFSGSESYRRDISLVDQQAAEASGRGFSKAEIDEFYRRAQKANAAMDGDQIEAWLQPVS